MSFNPHNENDRIIVQYRCCIAAVQTHFNHISVADILDPPHQWFDALLARQVAVHLLTTHFHVPRRRLCELLDRRRGTIVATIRTVDNRLSSPDFNAAYGQILERAESYFQTKLQEVA